MAARQTELLPVPYVHVVFTLPHQLAKLVYHNQRILYDLLFQTSAATLMEVAADSKHLGAGIGLLSVLHTWGQTLQFHPHVHCVIPRAGSRLIIWRWVLPLSLLPACTRSGRGVPRQVHRRVKARLQGRAALSAR
ncbi:MAG: transposase [Bryobacteraceae bacterium]